MPGAQLRTVDCGLYVPEDAATAEEVGRINPRPPARPVALGALAQMTDAGPAPDRVRAVPHFPDRQPEGVMSQEADTR